METPVEYNAGNNKQAEERIAFVKWNTGNNICPAPTELQCGGAKSCDECKVGMTRTEAIERIAKALCADDVMREGYYEMAEAALNALLGE